MYPPHLFQSAFRGRGGEWGHNASLTGRPPCVRRGLFIATIRLGVRVAGLSDLFFFFKLLEPKTGEFSNLKNHSKNHLR